MEEPRKSVDLKGVGRALRMLAAASDAQARALRAAADEFDRFADDVFEAGLADFPSRKELLTLGPMVIDREQMTLQVGDSPPININRKVMDVLLYLAARAEKVVLYEQLGGEFWPGSDNEHAMGSVRQTILLLKRILKSAGCREYLHEIRRGRIMLSATPTPPVR